MNSAGGDVLISSSSASPVKLKSPLVSTHPAVFSPQVAPLMPASDGSGAFQMGRYMCDSGDSVRRSSAADNADVGNVEPVDSSILETFDPLGYARNNIRQAHDVEGTEFDVDAASKAAISHSFIACSNDCSSVSGGDPSLQSTGSSSSLLDAGIAVGTSAGVVATGSSISVDTLTGCVREPTLLDTDSCESLDGHIVKRHTSAVLVSHEAACESGARPKTTVSVPFFPPRISISHLGDGSIQSKSSAVNGRQSLGPAELVEDGRTTAFHVVQGLPTRPSTRSGLITATSAATTTSVIEGASGLLNSRVSHTVV